jgi:hypothetical protein
MPDQRMRSGENPGFSIEAEKYISKKKYNSKAYGDRDKYF